MTREEAKEILTHNWTRVENPNYSESELDEAFFMAIEALQILEAVERIKTDVLSQTDMVRCKDCRHFDKHETWSACTYWSGDPYEQASVEDNDYCSRGERREL